MDSVVNIAAYKFVTLDDLQTRRDRLRRLTLQLDLKGTILLSTEGINLCVAGERAAIDRLLDELRRETEFADLQLKESFSAGQPFNRMLVKIKKETIAFAVEGIDPRQYTSRRLAPEQLCQWLDEGRSVTLLDVRNRFEVETGTFAGAVQTGIDDFRSFPAAARELPAGMKQSPVVTFCTGGIRCEKAAPFLEDAGFREVYQLDGGILKYFEQCGGKHYQGECFVFDKRVALDSSLRESDTTQCFACQATLSAEDQVSPQYQYGRSCPYCYVPPKVRQAELLALRNEAIRGFAKPLPGSVPYENCRPIRVPRRYEGVTVLRFLTEFTHRLTGQQWRDICAAGQLRRNRQPVGEDDLVHAGDRLMHVTPNTVEPDVNGAIELMHEDDSLVVVHKPAPLPMHPCGRFHRNTLIYLLNQVYRPTKLRPAHRLDANTSGVVVFCKTRKAAARVQPQFENGEVEKRYLARILGQPTEDDVLCDSAISSHASVVGTRGIDANGRPARTEIRVLTRFADGTSLVEARPLTGRTNQIRLHLWDVGFPIQGDPAYLPGQKLGNEQTLRLSDPPLYLFSMRVTLRHPETDAHVSFTAPLPTWVK